MKKILIIEDEDTVRKPIVSMLKLEGFAVNDSDNGEEGLVKAMNEQPDLILCDVMMPKVDGYEVLSKVRKEKGLRYTPFVFLTAKAEHGEVRKGMNLGAEDYLTKPVDREDILNAIHAQLSKQKTRERDQSERFDDIRMEIASSLPHELVTPLHGIIGMASVLESEGVEMGDAALKHMATDIRQCGERLHSTIEKFLYYSELQLLKSSSLEQHIEFEKVNSKQLVIQAVTHSQQYYHRENDIQLHLEDAIIEVPKKYIHNLIVQLLDNACKFSQPGTPIVVRSHTHENLWILDVSDSGLGMSPKTIAEIEAFRQFQRKNNEQQGSGLGLKIVQLTTFLLNGTLLIESQPQKGTLARVSMPCHNL